MTEYQLNKGISLKSKLDTLIAQKQILDALAYDKRVMPFYSLTAESDNQLRNIISADLNNQIREVMNELQDL